MADDKVHLNDVRLVVKALADHVECDDLVLTDDEAAALHRLADATGLCSATCEGSDHAE